MAIIIKDRVKETTTTTGTGAISMGGAVTGFRAASDAFSTGDQSYWCMEGGAEWEVFKGTLTSGSPWTLSRDSVYASSNAGAAVNFSAGTKQVYCSMPALLLVNSRPFMGTLVKLSADATAQNYSAAGNIPFDAELYDTHNFHDNATNNTRITIPSGYGITKVRFSGQVKIVNVSSGSRYVLQISKNGNVALEVGFPQINESSNTAVTEATYLVNSPVVTVADGDYFELRFTCSDTSVDIKANGTYLGVEVVEATGW